MYPFERFSETAKRVLTRTQEEAERSHHSHIGTEHLLLGLLRVEDGIAAHVLHDLCASLDRVRAELGRLHEAGALEGGEGLPSRSKEIRDRMQEGVAGMGEGTAGMSLRRGVARLAGQTLEAASRGAREQHTSVGPEHLLLALLDGDPLIRRMLVALGIDGEGIAEARRIATPPASLLELRRRWEARSADPAGHGTLHPSGPDRPAPMAAELGERARLRAELEEAERRWRAGEDRPAAGSEPGRKRPRRGRAEGPAPADRARTRRRRRRETERPASGEPGPEEAAP